MTCIKLCINDDGTMTVGQEQAEAMETEETGQPVKNIQQAIQIIQQMADAATMAAPEAMSEEQGMMGGFSPR